MTKSLKAPENASDAREHATPAKMPKAAKTQAVQDHGHDQWALLKHTKHTQSRRGRGTAASPPIFPIYPPNTYAISISWRLAIRSIFSIEAFFRNALDQVDTNYKLTILLWSSTVSLFS